MARGRCCWTKGSPAGICKRVKETGERQKDERAWWAAGTVEAGNRGQWMRGSGAEFAVSYSCPKPKEALVWDRFTDRREAGRVLAERLRSYAGRDDVVVLALPRGGVPVGFEVRFTPAWDPAHEFETFPTGV